MAEFCDINSSFYIDWVSTGFIPLSITLSHIEIFVLVTYRTLWKWVKFFFTVSYEICHCNFFGLRKAKLLQVVKGTKSEIDNLYIELHHPTRKCNLSNKLCSVNVIVICEGENRSVGEALGLRKGSKIFEYTTISEAVMSLPRSLYWQSRLQSVHKSRILSLVSQSLACGQMNSWVAHYWPMGKACSTSSTRTVSNTSANFALNDTSCSKSKRQGMAQLNAVYVTLQMLPS